MERRIDWTDKLVFVCAVMVLAWSPFSGGPRLFSLLLGLAGMWLAWKHRGEIWQVRAVRRMLLIFALLWLPMILSLVNSHDPGASLTTVAVLPLYLAMAIALIVVFRDEQTRQRLAFWFSVVLVIWAVDGLVQYIFGKDLLLIPLAIDGRVVGFFRDNTHLGLLLAVLVPVLFMELYRRYSAWALLAIPPVAAAVILGGSRSSWLMLLLALLMLVYVARFRYKVLAISSVILLSAGVVLFSPLAKHKVLQTSSGQEIEVGMIDRLLSGRGMIWKTAFNMARTYPFTGVGVQSFEVAFERYESEPGLFRKTYQNRVYHAHSAYFSILAESGFTGLLAIAAAWWLLLRWFFGQGKAIRRQAIPWGGSLFIATFPVNSQPILYSAWWFPVLILLLALMLAGLDANNGKEKKLQG